MKIKLLIVTSLMLLAVVLFAGEQSMQVDKDQLLEIAKLYKLDNDLRSVRLPAAPKANIAKPVHKSRPKKTAAGQTAQPATAQPSVDQPQVLNFSATTAWGTFKAEVIEHPGQQYFEVTFESPRPIQGLVVRDGPRKMDVYTTYFNDITAPEAPIRINYAYQPSYLMILKANVDGEIQPQIIPLYVKNNVKTSQ